MACTFIRSGDMVMIDGEQFLLSDILAVVSEYDSKDIVHYYDGKTHYRSDGTNQVGHPIPCPIVERILANKVGIRHCKTQRETDERHIESLKTMGEHNGSKLKRRT